jgi:hypothetical protein
VNRIAWVIAIGYAALALISAGMYAGSTTMFVDYSETLRVFPPPHVESATFTRTSGGWNVSLHWRVDNPGRLPIRLAIFVWYVALDNRSDPRAHNDGAKLTKEYYINGSLQRDRFTGPVIPPGGSVEVDWWVKNETSPENGQRIALARDPMNGGYYLAMLGGQVVFYVADITERQVIPVPPAFGRV